MARVKRVAGGPPFYSLGQLTEQIADSATVIVTCERCRNEMGALAGMDDVRRAAITWFMALPAWHREHVELDQEEKKDATLSPAAAD